VGAQQLALGRPGQQRLVQPVDGLLAHPAGELDQGGRMGHPAAQWDAAEPLPGDRVGDLAAQQLVAQLVAELQEHQPQVGLDRDRRTADDRVEVGPERLDERRVVQQPVHPGQLAGQPERLGGRIASHSEGWGLVVRSITLQSVVAQGIERILSPFSYPSNSTNCSTSSSAALSKASSSGASN
jgi:hypothetical protein